MDFQAISWIIFAQKDLHLHGFEISQDPRTFQTRYVCLLPEHSGIMLLNPRRQRLKQQPTHSTQ